MEISKNILFSSYKMTCLHSTDCKMFWKI